MCGPLAVIVRVVGIAILGTVCQVCPCCPGVGVIVLCALIVSRARIVPRLVPGARCCRCVLPAGCDGRLHWPGADADGVGAVSGGGRSLGVISSVVGCNGAAGSTWCVCGWWSVPCQLVPVCGCGLIVGG